MLKLFLLIASLYFVPLNACEVFYNELIGQYLEDRANVLVTLKNQFDEESQSYKQLVSKDEALDDYFFSFFEERQIIDSSKNWKELRGDFVAYLGDTFQSFGFKRKIEEFKNVEVERGLESLKSFKSQLLMGIEIVNSTFLKRSSFSPNVLKQMAEIFNNSLTESEQFMAQTLKNAQKMVNSATGASGIKHLKNVEGTGTYKVKGSYQYEIKYMGHFGKYRILGNPKGDEIIFEIVITK